MDVSIKSIRHAIKILLSELHPNISVLEGGCYSIDEILDQIVFELIKEDYKKHSEKHPIQYYLDRYDSEHYGTSRKYTRSIQYAQFYRDINNDLAQDTIGCQISELKAQDMSGTKNFIGYQLSEQEFFGLKMQAECKLLNKLHGKQIDSAKNVSETDFEKLFDEYAAQISELEPHVNSDPDCIISRVLAYYGTETHFLTEFLYRVTLAAEEYHFPKDIPYDRIKSVCSLSQYIPATDWCPEVYFADLCILPKWSVFGQLFFSADNAEWQKHQNLLLDCKRMKNAILQHNLDRWIKYLQLCSQKEKADFLIEHYWLWGNSPQYEWTPERIRFFRRLHASVMRDFPKPHIK